MFFLSNSRNSDIISIAFLGDFICEPPSRVAIMALYVFLEYLQKNTTDGVPVLHQNYTLYGHCQINIDHPEEGKFTDAPGAALLNEIMHWKRYVS